jgi:uncharacterized membrane protein SpoIIM required for sporulation
MREALFVKQNTAKWKRYENMQPRDPDELAESFITITDDLAYAKSFYPESSTTKYLNSLAARFHQSIYKNKKEKTNRFVEFWKYDLPLLFSTYRKQLLYAFIFFIVFTLIGIVSAKYDNTFVRLIFGDEYVNMTNANIAKGDPFGVYKQMDSSIMFVVIAGNNIYVALRTFIEGIFFSVGSVYELFKNGLMIGSFEYYFFSRGLGFKSILVIWIHGVIEMSSIIIAGAAGIVMGNSLLFPKTYTRMASFKKGATDGMKMAIGLIPLFLIAAFFESFVTRHTEMPVWLSCSILGISLVFIIWYVIVYPALLAHQIKTSKPLSHEK